MSAAPNGSDMGIGGRKDSGAMTPPCLLIVDDDEDMLETLTSSLSGRFHVTAVSGGRAALQAMEAIEFDAVVLDLSMPDVDGLDVLAALAERSSRPPVILASGIPTLPQVASAWKVRNWIAKPYQLERLEQQIERALTTTDH